MSIPTHPELKPFLVRKNCEYSVAVPATSMDDAVRRAEALADSEWSEAWSETTAEPD